MGRCILKSVLFFTFLFFSVGTESNKVVKESIYKLLSDKIIFISDWEVTLARQVYILVIIIKFTNLIFVHNSAYWQSNYKGQNGFGIQNMGFVCYRQVSLVSLLDTTSKLFFKMYLKAYSNQIALYYRQTPKDNTIDTFMLL